MFHAAEVKLNLHILNEMDGDETEFAANVASRLIYALVCHLNSNKTPRTLHLNARGRTRSYLAVEDFLNPLQTLEFLGPHVNLDIVGFSEPTMESLQKWLDKRSTTLKDLVNPPAFYNAQINAIGGVMDGSNRLGKRKRLWQRALTHCSNSLQNNLTDTYVLIRADTNYLMQVSTIALEALMMHLDSTDEEGIKRARDCFEQVRGFCKLLISEHGMNCYAPDTTDDVCELLGIEKKDWPR